MTIHWIDTCALNNNAFSLIFPKYLGAKICSTVLKQNLLNWQKNVNRHEARKSAFLTQSFWLLRNPHIAMFFSRRFCFVWNLLKLKVNVFYIFSNWNALWYALDCHMSTCWVSEITSWVCELIYLLNFWDHSLVCEFTCWIHEITSSVCEFWDHSFVCEFTCWVLEITSSVCEFTC